MTMHDSRRLLSLANRALKGWIDDGAPSMGAALAFYTLLTLAPLLLVTIAMAGFFLDRGAAQNALINQMAMLLGDKAAVGIESLLDAAGSRDEGLMPALIGIATMLVGATTVFAELRSDLDRIWRYKAPPSGGLGRALGARLLAFLMVMAAGALLLLSFVASTFLAAAAPQVFAGSPLLPHAVEFVASFGVITLLFAMIYKVLPSKPIAWRDVWVGAAFTSVLFWAGKFGIALYLGHSAIDSTFGAAGSLVFVIVWVYYSAQVFFLGAEFTREYALSRGSGRLEAGPARPLGEMNAPYEALLERAKHMAKAENRSRAGLFGAR